MSVEIAAATAMLVEDASAEGDDGNFFNLYCSLILIHHYLAAKEKNWEQRQLNDPYI